MRLSDLINAQSAAPNTTPAALVAGDPEIVGLTADSREVQPGYLFAALPGSRLDGRTYIAVAVAKGAAAVLTTPDVAECAVGLVRDADPRRRLARMAARFYSPQPETVVAVTGTNGKTSVAEFTRQIWNGAGYSAASIGTLGLTVDGETTGPSLTTPDPVRLHQVLHELAHVSVDHAALEASSHGLDQARLDGVEIAAAAFTNLTRDHLDYHGDMDAYRTAKLGLFDRVMAPGGTAVLNMDSPEFDKFREAAERRRHRVMSYGMRPGAELRLVERRALPTGQALEIAVGGRSHLVELGLIGDFQAWNVLAALGLTLGSGTPMELALEALPALTGVRGRMERVAVLDNGAAVYVDFAHTSDALETVLKAVRPHTNGELWCVFGCGGDRDPGKRPMMGAAVAKYADRPIVTDDNPRSENPALIRAATLAACRGGVEIGDRRTAIHETVARLGSGDVLVIAGKGHEQGQEIQGVKHPFDDATVAREAIAQISGAAGAGAA
ncbi:UDP-N-acetylmuramoyl-L-alanyl-D-glutamate--2,6-diaminopimelate ligase [Thalassobaculum sp. OXR-137]|uniref:UDP-N-acetylmuramoyl-L-alanyl-D-glutamate--2, 6-diaminopimelate ligase n=1 Tax=Thalassobaculum sp. OXR-137 TaxID=3100173 RepID=UPI002AC8BE1E|nr:UDP-N-acetylmuramoyl-L-alanyl-D-glutamate--2,6-diaminopimelate ligase [Thalassobaculum sp. OXR-137]WPZ32164.1 UDP-N-acetylmuramoyl-L-alanyl-D-glutamate--2,6-diaminopimelate ligase [Thalassobaculum sp. OXR-137]